MFPIVLKCCSIVIKAPTVSQLSDALLAFLRPPATPAIAAVALGGPGARILAAEGWNFACSGGGLPALLVNRQYNANNQSMRLPVIERQLAAVCQRDGARDRKAETEAGYLVHVAGVVATHEWLEHDILARIGNAGTIVRNI